MPVLTRKPQLASLLPHVAPVAIVAITLVWAFRDGGFPATSWYPAGLLIGGLVVAQALGRFLHVGRDLPTAAVASLIAFAALELASVVWASSKGAAWDSANRTFVYGFIFLLFAGWRSSQRSKHVLVLLLVGGLTAVALRSLYSAAQHPADAFLSGRLSAPTGYANATAALFLIPFWPAASLAADRTRGALFRALALGCAAALAAVAYVPESRGALYAFPLGVLALLVLAKDRFRTTIALTVALAPTAYFVHTLSRPYAAVTLHDRGHATHQALLAAIIAGLVAATLGGGLAFADRRYVIPVPAWSRYARIVAIVVAAAALIGVAATHDPRAAVRNAWTSFRAPAETDGVGGTRLFGNLGSNRYDFWRVALIMTKRHPVLGVGADNFGEAYLQDRRSEEQPQYPHSLEMSVLSQTGVLGALIFLLFAGLVVAVIARARREAAASGALVAGCGAAFAYWMIHGSVDWLWEFPALGGAAFVLLGVIGPSLRTPTTSRGLRLVAVVLTAVISLSFVGPWLALRQTDRASGVWRSDPRLAYDLIHQASWLNPLSDNPALTEMTIAAERGDVARMRSSAERAIARDHHNWFSQLQLAVALSNQKRWTEAKKAAADAHRLNPAEPLVAMVIQSIHSRRALRPNAIDRAALGRLQVLDPRLRPSRKAG